jgi:hypothetical protein
MASASRAAGRESSDVTTIIYVTRTEIELAKLKIELSERAGRRVPPGVVAIATAKRAKKDTKTAKP